MHIDQKFLSFVGFLCSGKSPRTLDEGDCTFGKLLFQ